MADEDKGIWIAFRSALVFTIIFGFAVAALFRCTRPEAPTHDAAAEQCFAESPEIDPACARFVGSIKT